MLAPFGLAMLTSLVGSNLIYLHSRHQLWLQQPLSLTFSRLGGILIICSLVILLMTMQPLAAVFSLIVWVMLLLGIFPYLGALKQLRKRKPHRE